MPTPVAPSAQTPLASATHDVADAAAATQDGEMPPVPAAAANASDRPADTTSVAAASDAAVPVTAAPASGRLQVNFTGKSWIRITDANGKTLLDRSEEHTSELQSLMRISYAVFCLKKKKQYKINNRNQIYT